MLFNSWVFIAVFLPVVFAVFWGLQRRVSKDVSFSWLVAASLFFYGWWNPVYVLLILTSILFNFSLGTLLIRPRTSKRRKKAFLILGITANLGALAYFKYAGFFLQTLSTLGAGISVPDIVLPLAISFFTFQQITYLVDAWKGETKELNFRHYTLFVTFFPQLIAGPIVHHKEMLPQFLKLQSKTFNLPMITMGLTVFIIGLFKKVAIADRLAEAATPVFDAAARGAALTLVEAWIGPLAYTFQLYFDFSGYSDMAVGLAALFGIRLPLNFFSPYKACSIAEFWRRWHVTLSRFLKDYLYIPLGGNRKGSVRRYINLLITMILGGLWHGANWTFVIWGALHGVYLAVNHLFRSCVSALKLSAPDMLRPFLKGLGWCVTFFAVIIGWVFFRAESLETALHLLNCMAGAHGIALQHPDSWAGDFLRFMGADVLQSSSRLLRLNEKWYLLAAAFILSVLAPSTHELTDKKLALDTTGVAKTAEPRLVWTPNKTWALLIGLMGAVSLLSLTRVSEFLYFQF